MFRDFILIPCPPVPPGGGRGLRHLIVFIFLVHLIVLIVLEHLIVTSNCVHTSNCPPVPPGGGRGYNVIIIYNNNIIV